MSEPQSPLEQALVRVGDKWTLLVIEALLEGPRRFGELADLVRGIAPNILSQRLKNLEKDGLVVARAYSQRPPRADYELTAAGKELAGALRLLAQWGGRHTGAAAPVHAACGTPMENRWYCPTCARSVDDPASGDLHYA